MFDAVEAMSDTMRRIGISVDGGKDSLSMAARVGSNVVKSPGELTVSVYAHCPDVTLTVTPDFKGARNARGPNSRILFVDLSGLDNAVKPRLGGSALAQCFQQVGNTTPTVNDEAHEHLVSAFEIVQELLKDRIILSGHDRSDGGLICAVLEMAFAGNCGFSICISNFSRQLSTSDSLALLFGEELGLLMEVEKEHCSRIMDMFSWKGVPIYDIGEVRRDVTEVDVSIMNGPEKCEVLHASMEELRDIWESTSFALERRQCTLQCVDAEQQGLLQR